MTNEEIHREVQLTLEILQAAEQEATYHGYARISGALASGKNMLLFLSNRFGLALGAQPPVPEEQKECT